VSNPTHYSKVGFTEEYDYVPFIEKQKYGLIFNIHRELNKQKALPTVPLKINYYKELTCITFKSFSIRHQLSK
jgi:hypothetical protein